MRLMAQPTGIDFAVNDIGINRFGLGFGERLSGRRGSVAVASGAARCAWVAGATFLDELMARKAGDLGHAMLAHGHFGVATLAR
jgi:hypothetical protein